MSHTPTSTDDRIEALDLFRRLASDCMAQLQAEPRKIAVAYAGEYRMVARYPFFGVAIPGQYADGHKNPAQVTLYCGDKIMYRREFEW